MAVHLRPFVSAIVIFVLKRDFKLQLTNQLTTTTFHEGKVWGIGEPLHSRRSPEVGEEKARPVIEMSAF